MKNYLLAIATLMGTIIGVGIFAMPYVISRSGIVLLFVYMAILAVIQYYLHLYFAEIVLSTNGDHRLPGYMEKYFGENGRNITLFLQVACDFGAILTYVIVGGLFLHQLLHPIFGGSVFFYTTAFFMFKAIIIFFGIKIISEAEFLMTGALVAIMLLISSRGLFLIDSHNFQAINWPNMFLPYGPVFFAISGSAAIPEVCKLLADQKEKIKSAIAWGTFASAAFMTFFVFVVVGVSGAGTTPDALSGLANYFSPMAMNLMLVFGLLTSSTSMLIITQASREVFWWDFKVDKNISWALACFIPFVLYLVGAQNLTKTVSLTGAISGGILGIVVIVILINIKKKCDLKSIIKCPMNHLIGFSLSLLFLFGFVYEVWNVFFNKI